MSIGIRSLTDQSLATGAVDEAAAQIAAETGSLLSLSSTGGTITTDGNEQTLYIADEPLGVWRPLYLVIDLDAMLAGDTIVLKVYHRLSDAGGLQLFNYATWTGADGTLPTGRKVDLVTLYPNRHGWQATIQRTGGVDRAYPWELYSEA